MVGKVDAVLVTTLLPGEQIYPETSYTELSKAAYVCNEDMWWALKSLIILHVVKLFGLEEERLPIEDLSHITTEADLFFFSRPWLKKKGSCP